MTNMQTITSSLHIDPTTLDFELPEELIAQEPLAKRDHARLMVIDRKTGEIAHRKFFNLVDYLKAGDVLVLNQAKVSPAKLVGKKKTGGRVEVILISPEGPDAWRALVRPLLPVGTWFTLEGETDVV